MCGFGQGPSALWASVCPPVEQGLCMRSWKPPNSWCGTTSSALSALCFQGSVWYWAPRRCYRRVGHSRRMRETEAGGDERERRKRGKGGEDRAAGEELLSRTTMCSPMSGMPFKCLNRTREGPATASLLAHTLCSQSAQPLRPTPQPSGNHIHALLCLQTFVLAGPLV